MRVCGALLIAALAAPAASSTQQVCTERDALYRLDGEALVWSGVRAASSDGSLLAVLTESFPAVHLFALADGGRRGGWGGSGEGPGEFQEATGIALVEHRVHVLDGGQRRLSIFDSTGALVRTVNLHDAGLAPYYPRRLERAEADAILFDLAEPMGDERIIIARTFAASADEESARQDTVLVYPRTTATRLRLTAPGAPGLTVSSPYSPAPQWTPVSEGVAFWQGPDAEVRILGFDGDLRSVVSLALDDRFEITAEDRESWFQNTIPEELFGQRVFEPLREEARRTVDFPRHHPLMFELVGDPNDFLWVRRTPDGRDQVWDIVDTQGQIANRVSLTPGQTLLAVVPEHLVVKVTDDLGVESVEVLRCG